MVAFILRLGLAGTLVLNLAIRVAYFSFANLGVGGIAPFKGCGWIQRLCSWVQKLYVVHITLGLLLFLVYRFEAGFYFKPCIDSQFKGLSCLRTWVWNSRPELRFDLDLF